MPSFLKDNIISNKYLEYIYNEYQILLSNENPPQQNETILKLVNMVAVSSLYARKEMGDKILTEAFAYWYLTPPTERNYYWGLIHQYFTNDFWNPPE